MVLTLGILFLILVIGIQVLMQYRQKKVVSTAPLVIQKAYQLHMDDIRMPAGLYFHPSHTWGHMSEKGTIQTGLDDFIVHVLGRITKIESSATGERVKQGDRLFSINQGDNAITLKSPVNGTVTALNERVLKDPNVLARLPYSDNWICEVTPDDWTQDTHSLLLGNSARSWLKREMNRLRDFFANLACGASSDLAPVALQDGGEVADGVLQYQSADVWQAFQTEFLDIEPS